MKNKKLISLICALSMIFSMFTAMTVRADGVGIELSGDLSEDGRYVTINATATGVTDNVIVGFQLDFNVPDGVTSKDQIKEATCPGNSTVAFTPTVSNGVVKMNYLDLTDNGIEFKDGKLATVVFDLGEGNTLDSNYTATLEGTANIMSKNFGDGKVSSGMTASTTTVKKWVDPNAKSEAKAQPARETESTTTVPTEVKPTENTAAIALEGSINKDNNEITIIAKATGVTDNIIVGFQLDFNVPDGVTSKDQIKEATCPGNSTVALTPTVSNGVVKMNYLDLTDNGVEFKDGVLAKVVFALPEGSELTTGYYEAKLENTANIMSKNFGDGKVSSGMTAATAVVTPTEADKGKATTVNLKDYMGVDKSDNNKKAEDVAAAQEEAGNGDKLYITVDVTKEVDGNRVSADYGTDYEAVYNGKTLTKAEYNNLIHGYTDDKISDVIKGLQFKVYDTAKNAKINTTLNSTDSDTQLVNDQTKEDVKSSGTTEEPKDTQPTISVQASTSSVTAGDNTAVKVYVSNITNEKEDGKLYVQVNEGALDLVTGTGIRFLKNADDTEPTIIQVEKVDVPIAKGSATENYIQFKGATKGTVTFTFTYEGTGEVTGDPVTATATKSITIKAASTKKDSSSGSTSSGGGAIANGLVDSGASTLLPYTFDDMGNATWATEAVTSLAARKIVSGVGDNKFDPDGALTRAAYAQMLVNAIGHSQDSADTYFNDVPTDAWFYHNVAVAAQLGIVSGYGDGNFGPYDLITREQMALMTLKAAQVMSVNLTGADAGTFSDDAAIADWSRDAVYTLANAGIINGMGDGTFAPKANATRAQAAVIIYNTFIK